MLMFVPMGISLPVVSKVNRKQVLFIGLILSMTIEALQVIFRMGTCETNDVIVNTVGCMVDYFIFEITTKLQKCIKQ